MRSIATALLLYLLASVAGAQCMSPASIKTALAQDLYGAPMPQPIQLAQPGQGGFVKTAGTPATRVPQAAPANRIAQPGPTTRIAQPAPATRIAQPAPRGSAQGTRPSTNRSPGPAALYAAIAVMAAIALRRRGL